MAETALFDVIDPRPSRYWHAEIFGFEFSLLPQEFSEPYFVDRATDYESAAVAVLREVAERLDHEFDEEEPPLLQAKAMTISLKQLSMLLDSTNPDPETPASRAIYLRLGVAGPGDVVDTAVFQGADKTMVGVDLNAAGEVLGIEFA